MRFKKILINITILFLISSCKKNDCESLKNAKNIMGTYYYHKINFSDKIECINQEGLSKIYSDKLINPTFKYRIIHFFDADCSKCVNELQNIKKQMSFFEKNKNIKLILMASTPHKSTLEYVLSKSKLEIPVYYIEGYKVFKKINKFPLDDTLYDTMLVNEKNELILFGSFFDNSKAQNMFTDIINCNR